MKKILITIFVIVFLIGTIAGTISLTQNITFDKDKLERLRSIGIGKELFNETCIKYEQVLYSNISIYDEKTGKITYNLTYQDGECLKIDGGSLGFAKPIINNCTKINEFSCKSNVYQKEGINKDITIEYHYCNEWTNATDEIEIECLSWTTLNKNQIEDKIKLRFEELLNKIIEVDENRNLNKESLTDGIEVTIG